MVAFHNPAFVTESKSTAETTVQSVVGQQVDEQLKQVKSQVEAVAAETAKATCAFAKKSGIASFSAAEKCGVVDIAIEEAVNQVGGDLSEDTKSELKKHLAAEIKHSLKGEYESAEAEKDGRGNTAELSDLKSQSGKILKDSISKSLENRCSSAISEIREALSTESGLEMSYGMRHNQRADLAVSSGAHYRLYADASRGSFASFLKAELS